MIPQIYGTVRAKIALHFYIQVNKHILYTKSWWHIGLIGNGGIKSLETRFDWNETGYRPIFSTLSTF